MPDTPRSAVQSPRDETSRDETPEFRAALERFVDQSGVSLRQRSEERPTLVVFLRHSGCPFCRETLARLANQRAELDTGGVAIALVHMMTDAEAAPFFARYGMDDVPRFSDPDRALYAGFGLARGGLAQVAGPAVWWRGFQTTILKGHLPGKPQGDVFQLPGTFVLHQGRIVHASRPTTSVETIDFQDVLRAARLPIPPTAR